MKIIDLGGHSGCKILLYESDDNKRFVRKVSANIEYNKRLKIQSKKQSDFCNTYIKVPKVLREGYTKEGLYYFDMEFIQGITLSKYIEIIEISKINEITMKIVNYIKTEKVSNTTANQKIFKEKIKLLREQLGEGNSIIKEAISILNKHSWSKFYHSNCHGDLTLENIIIKNDELYLIDFLDSFYDCWILDISTILQDVELLWSYRYNTKTNINTILRLFVFKDIFLDAIKEDDSSLYIEVYYALLLKVIRIFPYAKDNLTYKFLEDKIKYIIDIIQREQLL